MNVRYGRPFGAMAVSAAVLLMAACGSDNDADTASSSESGGTNKVIGVMTLVAADQPIERLVAGIEKEAAEQGFEIRTIDANYDPQKAAGAIQTFVSQKVDGIINIAGENSALEGAFRAAEAADIPVVSINAGDPVQGVTVNRDYPDTDLGAELATEFFDAIADIDVANPVVIEQVLPAASPCRRREIGFDQVTKGHPDVEIVKYQINGTNAAADASTYTSQYLATHPNVVGVLSCWDVPAAAAATAAEAAGKKQGEFVVAGFNGTTTALEQMRRPDSVFEMTAGFAGAAVAKGAVDDIAEAIDGGSPKKTPSTQVGVFTKDNMPEGDSIELDEWLPEGWTADFWK